MQIDRTYLHDGGIIIKVPDVFMLVIEESGVVFVVIANNASQAELHRQ